MYTAPLSTVSRSTTVSTAEYNTKNPSEGPHLILRLRTPTPQEISTFAPPVDKILDANFSKKSIPSGPGSTPPTSKTTSTETTVPAVSPSSLCTKTPDDEKPKPLSERTIVQTPPKDESSSLAVTEKMLASLSPKELAILVQLPTLAPLLDPSIPLPDSTSTEETEVIRKCRQALGFIDSAPPSTPSTESKEKTTLQPIQSSPRAKTPTNEKPRSLSAEDKFSSPSSFLTSDEQQITEPPLYKIITSPIGGRGPLLEQELWDISPLFNPKMPLDSMSPEEAQAIISARCQLSSAGLISSSTTAYTQPSEKSARQDPPSSSPTRQSASSATALSSRRSEITEEAIVKFLASLPPAQKSTLAEMRERIRSLSKEELAIFLDLLDNDPGALLNPTVPRSTSSEECKVRSLYRRLLADLSIRSRDLVSKKEKIRSSPESFSFFSISPEGIREKIASLAKGIIEKEQAKTVFLNSVGPSAENR